MPPPAPRKKRTRRRQAVGIAAGIVALIVGASWWIDHSVWVLLAFNALELSNLAMIPEPAWTLLGLSLVLALVIVALDWALDRLGILPTARK